MHKGFDAAFNTAGILSTAQAQGLAFIGRYYSHSEWKNLTRAEAQAISAAGMTIIPVWEVNADPNRFTETYGMQDGGAAVDFAVQRIGQPEGTCIYFAVDFDATGNEMIERVVPYFRGVTKAVGGRFRIGAYGSGFVLTTLRDNRLIEYCWLAGASGWRGSKDFTGWHVKQYPPGDPYGFGTDVDPNDAVEGDFGEYRLAVAPAPPPEPARRMLQKGMSGADVAEAQRLLTAKGFDPLSGYFGDETDRATRAFQQARKLDVDGIIGPDTWAELDTPR